MTPKAQATKKKKKKKKHMVLHQAKNFLHSKRNDQQSEWQPTECKKNLQILYLIRDKYPKYMYIDISPKKIYKRPTSTWKDAQDDH